MVFAVPIVELVRDVVAAALVHARRESPQRLVAQRRGVQQRCHQRARALGPVIVTAITSTARATSIKLRVAKTAPSQLSD